MYSMVYIYIDPINISHDDVGKYTSHMDSMEKFARCQK